MAPTHDMSVAPEPGARGPGAAECGPAAGQAATPALEVRNLTLAWEGSETPTVSDVSLAVVPGEMVCLVGRSGCGKSTLFHGMAGLTTPVSGSVLLHGEDVTGRPGRVSYMLQKDLLLPQRTIMANVCLPLTLAGTPRAMAREKAEPLFERFGLNGTQDSYPSELSGGMRQRAALLRTYLMDNDVVLMDEPFSALDALTRQDMRSWFLSLVSDLGMSCVLVTHDVDEAVEMADRILVMSGNPTAGVPSGIMGEVDIDCARGQRAEWLLTPASLEAKREVLLLLG
ncbi:ABC transporter ATP-binding protein [Parolsenella catena]|uniref:ABC transporter ATP-binding protein n=1 Tax=Parolsenella catena TaxID=2003188 RepID=UPI0029439A6B|nr:ABC transporter ATP-binding protein [Parolsenella catena]